MWRNFDFSTVIFIIFVIFFFLIKKKFQQFIKFPTKFKKKIVKDAKNNGEEKKLFEALMAIFLVCENA